MEIYRGDIWFVNKHPYTCGVEQMPGRPAVIVSNDTGNRYSDQVEIVYLTSKQKKPMPTHVNVMCDVPSIALCEQVTTVDKMRLDRFVKECTPEEMANIDRALMVSLGIEPPKVETTCKATIPQDQLKQIVQESLDEYFGNRVVSLSFAKGRVL